jgi:hypothetical protein
MNTPTLGSESPSQPVHAGAADGAPARSAVQRRAFSPAQLAFLLGVPLAWAALLWFHPSVERDDVYGSLRDQVTAYQIVHVGTLIFIALIGVALYLMVRDLPGRAARISRLAIGPFVLFYGAYETVIGLAIGALVQHGNDAPVSQRPAVAEAIQSLGDNVIVGDPGVLGGLGVLAWIVAVIAAAVAYRRVGAPALATVLLGLSLLVVSHPPPIGPIALFCFAAAVALLARHERSADSGETHVAMKASLESLSAGRNAEVAPASHRQRRRP